MRQAKVLYFVDGYAPKQSDLAAARLIAGKVEFRNARVVQSTDNPEKADAVAGAVPSIYADYKTADQLNDEVSAELDLIDDKVKKKAGRKPKAKAEEPAPVTNVISPPVPPVQDGDVASAAGWSPN
jgi:hypothetical protein